MKKSKQIIFKPTIFNFHNFKKKIQNFREEKGLELLLPLYKYAPDMGELVTSYYLRQKILCVVGREISHRIFVSQVRIAGLTL